MKTLECPQGMLKRAVFIHIWEGNNAPAFLGGVHVLQFLIEEGDCLLRDLKLNPIAINAFAIFEKEIQFG